MVVSPPSSTRLPHVTHHNFVLHASITTVGNCLDSATVRRHGSVALRRGWVGAVKVVLHFRVQLLRRLGLRAVGVSATARLLASFRGRLGSSRRLRLGLRSGLRLSFETLAENN